MSVSLLSLLEQMKTARGELNQATSYATNCREAAIHLEKELVLATEAVHDATQYLTHVSGNPSLLYEAEKKRNEALQKLTKTTRLADEAANRANEADKIVARAFITVKEASEQLLLELKNTATKQPDM
ncbi:hypothetical protein ACVNS2_08100 [Paenibacillus caseinilyticus]|uniref:Uncharacterized protein n=1 Tax=Paenibacillus mucilaginosus K02 TaxID=997761 RepID=I0BE28_9BACL|nr:hypothetical protein [Paenibacillus mucilaginosus]AFH60625.1 hypothetical protein B2K_07805 [Paenibacillus mucilaginosus K02]